MHQFLDFSSCFSPSTLALGWIAEDIDQTVVLCDSVLSLLQIPLGTLG